jgi:hypothetical protein
MRTGAMIGCGHDENLCPALDETNFGSPEQHPADPTPLMAARHAQHHDLTVPFVDLIKATDSCSDDTNNLRIVTRHERGVAVVADDRLEQLPHLAGR